MTKRVSIQQTGLSDYVVAIEPDPFGGCPALWGLVNDSTSSKPRAVRIGDGILTRRSREEVARITRRLNGRMKL